MVFTPFSIGYLHAPNRFVRSATTEGLANEEGFVTPELIAFIKTLATGGLGTVILGYSYVSPEGKQLPRMTGVTKDEHIAGLQQLVTEVKQAAPETLLVLQLVHAGGQALPECNGNREIIGPSDFFNPTYKNQVRSMTLAEIDRVKADFVSAARRGKAAGFDAIQLHAAHGYLISQFLTPLTNQRNDQYGGSIENRFRFLMEVVSDIKKELGADYPLWIKINGADFFEGGLELKDSLFVATELEKRGAAAIEVSGGTPMSGRLTVSRMRIKTSDDEAYFLPELKAYRETVKIPLIAIGGYRSLEKCAEIVSSGAADLIALSRPLIREPKLILRWKKGDKNRALCISCNRCFKESMSEAGLGCFEERKKTS